MSPTTPTISCAINFKLFFPKLFMSCRFYRYSFQHKRFHWFNAIFFFTPKSCCPRRISILWKYRFVVVNAHVHSYPALDIGGKRTHKKEQQTSLDDHIRHSQNKYNYRKTIAAAYPGTSDQLPLKVELKFSDKCQSFQNIYLFLKKYTEERHTNFWYKVILFSLNGCFFNFFLCTQIFSLTERLNFHW